MKNLIFNKAKYKKDITAQQVLKYLEENNNEYEDSLCFYDEPEYPGTERPTFTFFHRELGVFVIKVFNYTDEMIDEMNDNYWKINGKKERNEVKLIEEYAYYLKTDLEKPNNKLKNKIKFKTIIIFPYINKTEINQMKEFSDVNFLYSDFRTEDIFSQM